MESLVSDNCHDKGCISLLYDMLVCSSPESSPESYVDRLNAWKEDIQEDISFDDWGEICSEAHRQTANTRLRFLQYNYTKQI